MIFNSVTYLIFLTLVVALYWSLPTRLRLWLVFSASIVFYGFWRFDFVPLMVFSAVVDYFVSRRMSETKSTRARKLLLFASLFVNLSLLAVFKYLTFAVSATWDGLAVLGVAGEPPLFNIILPLGISFYTFQTISYSIDVYRRQIEPINDFLLYACYVTYFPQLVAGPILRANEVAPQLLARPQFKLGCIPEGLSRILAGLFLKVVLADNIAGWVNDGFDVSPGQLAPLDVWTIAFLFGFQIYFDFAAYSHIAIGSALLMGIRFPENFRFPYAAVSPRDFWGRWHISLSSWIRDYLYLPLRCVEFKGNSQGGLESAVDVEKKDRKTFALFATWAIMGFWHGAGFNFLAWGLYHAAIILAYRLLEPIRTRMPEKAKSPVGWALTLPFMMAGWIFFRAESLEQSLQLASRLFAFGKYTQLGLRENNYLVAFFLLVSVTVANLYWTRLHAFVASRKLLAVPIYASAYSIALWLTFVFLRPVEQFIYFQF